MFEVRTPIALLFGEKHGKLSFATAAVQLSSEKKTAHHSFEVMEGNDKFMWTKTKITPA